MAGKKHQEMANLFGGLKLERMDELMQRERAQLRQHRSGGTTRLCGHRTVHPDELGKVAVGEIVGQSPQLFRRPFVASSLRGMWQAVSPSPSNCIHQRVKKRGMARWDTA